MATLRRQTSEESAAGFVASQRRRAQREAQRRARLRQLNRLPAAPPERVIPRRIALDLAEPTLRLIHEVLLDAMHASVCFGDRGALLMIAEQMVATALGDPPCDDPPLTDRDPG